MKKNYIILISVFAGGVGIFLIIVGVVIKGQVKIEEVKPATRAEAPMKPAPSLKKPLALEDLERPKELMQPAGIKEEDRIEEKEKEYALGDIPVEEARQVEAKTQAEMSEGATEGGPAEGAEGEKKINVYPPADKLDEMKTQGVVIY